MLTDISVQTPVPGLLSAWGLNESRLGCRNAVVIQTVLMHTDQTLPVFLGSRLQMMIFEVPGKIYSEFVL